MTAAGRPLAVERHWLRALPAVLAGAVLGVVGARYVLVGSALSLLPWALVGLLIGRLAGSRAAAVGSGAGYGFALAFAFMVAGYDGEAPLAHRLLPFAGIGLVGAGCGAVLGYAGYRLLPRTLSAR